MKKVLFIGLMVLVFLAGAAGAAEPVRLKFATFAPPKAVSNTITYGPWIKRMNAEGTVKIDMYMGGTLGRDPKLQYKLLQDGVADIAFMVQDWIAGQFPDDSIMNVPFMATNAAESCFAGFGMFKRGLLRGYDDIKVLAHIATGTNYVHSSYPVRHPKELRGRKFVVSGKFHADIFKQLGAVGVGIPSPKIAENMSRGVVEGATLDISALFAFRVNDVAKYHLLLPFGNASLLVAMNKKVYESLPPAARATIDKYSGEPLVRAWAKMIDDQVKSRLEQLEKDPKHHIVIPSAEELKEWKASVQPVIDAWQKGDPKRAMLVKAYQEELDRIRADR